ncbi:unnamed protein product, partial [Brassica oleracea]
MRGGIQICYPHVILNCGSLDQHGFAMTIYLHEFLKSSLVDLHLKPSEEDLKQWSDTWPLNIDFFRKINSKPFRFLFAYHTYLAASDIRCWLFLTSLARKAQFQEVELEKQPSSSKRRLQSLAKKRQDVQSYYISPRKTSVVVLLTVLFYDSRKVRIKRNSSGQITEEESTNNTIYEWSTKPWVSIRFVDSLQHLGSKELLQIITTISFTYDLQNMIKYGNQKLNAAYYEDQENSQEYHVYL